MDIANGSAGNIALLPTAATGMMAGLATEQTWSEWIFVPIDAMLNRAAQRRHRTGEKGEADRQVLMVCSMLQTIKLACNLTINVWLHVGVKMLGKIQNQFAKGVEKCCSFEPYMHTYVDEVWQHTFR